MMRYRPREWDGSMCWTSLVQARWDVTCLRQEPTDHCCGTARGKTAQCYSRITEVGRHLFRAMGFLPEMQNCGLCMRRECKGRIVSDPDMHHGTCVTHVP